ncbi:hypothetical protein ACS0TY_022989 [Phlomoides rotata]
MKAQISLTILITLLIIHSDAVPHRNDQNLIETTCKRTPDYRLCTAIIRANPDGGAADLPGLGLIVVDVVKQKSHEALSIINKLTKSGQPKLRPALRRCTEVYKAVLEGDIPVVSQSIWGNPKFAETAVADAGAEAGLCDEAVGGKVPELSKVNNYVVRVAGVARAIIRNLL